MTNIKRKRKRTIKRATQRSVNRLLKGLIISWEEDAATEEIIDTNVTHKASVYRPLCNHIWAKHGERIYRNLPMTWRIHITAIFTDTQDSTHIQEQFETVAFTLLSDLAPAVQPWLDDIMSIEQEIALETGQPYRHEKTLYTVECMGNRQAIDKDYAIREDPSRGQ